MKAGSTIFTTIQRPYTMLGIPPKLGVFTIGIGVVIFVLLTVFNQQELGLLIALIGITSGLITLWSKQRKNYHFEARVLVTIPSWIGKIRGQSFIAGKAPLKKKKKGKKRAN